MGAKEDAQAKTWTLSTVAVQVKISSDTVGTVIAGSQFNGPGKPDDPSTPAVLVTEVSITYRVNNLADASIALGYSSPTGLSLLQKLFPRANEGAYLARVEITVGKAGPLSYAPIKEGSTKPLFTGVIVGFSHSKSGSGISFVVNAFSSAYPLTQIAVSSPGYHPTAGEGLGVVSMISNANFAPGGGDLATRTAGSLGSLLGEVDNPVDAALGILREIIGVWDLSPDSGNVPDELRDALRTWGLPGTKAEVEKHLSNIVKIGDVSSILFIDALDPIIEDLLHAVLQQGGMTFWTYLLAIFDRYGIDMLPIGDKIFCIAMNPLGFVPSNNVIKATELSSLTIKDFPFDSPTRCVVVAPEGVTRAGTVFQATGIHPRTPEPTLQETKTGIKTITVQAPAFLSSTVSAAADIYRDEAVARSLEGGKKPSTEVQAINAAQLVIEEEVAAKTASVYDKYAQYMLMKSKFRQRTGSCVTRFRPDILPGFCVQIEDPLQLAGLAIATVFAYVSEITHTLSQSSAVAQTSIGLSYVNYSGETPADLVSSPLFPNFDIAAAAKTILQDGLGYNF